MRRSAEDPAWFWPLAIEDMGLEFSAPWSQVYDDSRGPEWTTWFTGGRVSIAHNCVHRWAERTPAAVAAVGLGEDGSRTALTFAELSREVTRLAEALVRLGVREGDRVAIFLPMSPEVAIASHACAHVGAIQVPIFSGFAAPAVAQRLRASEAKVAITTRESSRRGKPMPMLAILEEARREAPAVEHVVVAPWDELVADCPGTLPALEVDSETPYLLTYTSGHDRRAERDRARPGRLPRLDRARGLLPGRRQRGRRRPFRHGHGLDHGTVDGRRRRRARRDDRVRRRRARLAGRPALAHGRARARHLARAFADARARARAARRPDCRPLVAAHLRHHRRTVEPGPYRWLFDTVGGGRVPIINCSGGTEVGACFLSPVPSIPIKACSVGGPALGMAMDIVDDEGRSLVGTGEVGELVCRKPFPGMTRGFWRDPERYLETYWRRFPGVWVHGDWASADEDGFWFLHGRSDDTLNIAGKRIGPAELESAAIAHPAVREAAAIGVPHEVKGEVAWIFCCLLPGAEPSEADVAETVAAELGRAFKPERVLFVEALPKTRSAKIVRRAVRATALGTDPGDLSSLENPESLDAIAAVV